MGIMAFHFFFDFEVLVRERLADLLRFKREHTLESLFLRPQQLDLLLVVIQLFSQSLDQLFQRLEFAFQVGSVVCNATRIHGVLGEERGLLGTVADLGLKHRAGIVKHFALLEQVLGSVCRSRSAKRIGRLTLRHFLCNN